MLQHEIVYFRHKSFLLKEDFSDFSVEYETILRNCGKVGGKKIESLEARRLSLRLKKGFKCLSQRDVYMLMPSVYFHNCHL